MTLRDLLLLLKTAPPEYLAGEVLISAGGGLEAVHVLVYDPTVPAHGDAYGCVWICSRLHSAGGDRLFAPDTDPTE